MVMGHADVVNVVDGRQVRPGHMDIGHWSFVRVRLSLCLSEYSESLLLCVHGGTKNDYFCNRWVIGLN